MPKTKDRRTRPLFGVVRSLRNGRGYYTSTGSLTVLSLLSVHDAFNASEFLYAGEEDCFFALVVALQHLVPSKTVADKVGVVGGLKVGRLLIDAIVAADEDIMDDCHVRCVDCEVIRL